LPAPDLRRLLAEAEPLGRLRVDRRRGGERAGLAGRRLEDERLSLAELRQLGRRDAERDRLRGNAAAQAAVRDDAAAASSTAAGTGIARAGIARARVPGAVRVDRGRGELHRHLVVAPQPVAASEQPPVVPSLTGSRQPMSAFSLA